MLDDINGLRNEIERILKENGLELIDVKIPVSRGDKRLRVFADKEGGITIDDCVEMSRKIEDFMYIKGIARDYSLEVSSPGPDRPLKTERDFNRIIGKKVRIQSQQIKEGTVSGKVVECVENIVRLDVKGEQIEIPLSSILKARIEFEIP